MANNSTFIRITNKDIYDKLERMECIEKKMQDNQFKMHEENRVYIDRVDKKVNKAVIVSGIAMSVALIVIVFILNNAYLFKH